MLDAVLQSPEMLSPSPSDDRTTPSLHNIPLSVDSDSPIYTTQAPFVSPTADTRRPHHRLLGYLVARSSQLTFDLSTGLSHEGKPISSSTAEDQGTPVRYPNDIYPVA